jgi:hypothetical protein
VISTALLAAFCAELPAADKKPAAYAVIGGTVFQESGFSLAGATVSLNLVTLNLKESSSLHKFKKMDAVSDARGEFAFRVPAAAARYLVRATAKGFHPADHEVEVSGEQFAEAIRSEVNLVLTREAETKLPASESK